MSVVKKLYHAHDEIPSELTFVWKISNLDHCSLSKGQKVVSPRFKLHSYNVLREWHLLFYPRGKNTDSVECSLSNASEYEGKIYCNFLVYSTKRELLYREQRELTYSRMLGKPKDLALASFEREMLKISDDAIVLHCHIGKLRSDKREDLLHCFAETCLSLRSKIFNWKVENFRFLQLEEEKSFGKVTLDKCFSTTLKLFLLGTNLKDAAVHIWLTFDGLTDETFCSCALYLMDENGRALKYMEKDGWLDSVLNVVKFSFNRKETTTWSTDTLILGGEVNLSGDNNPLQEVVYTVKSTEKIADAGFPTKSLPYSKDRPSSLSADMKSLFRGDGPPADFELRVAGRIFPVHQTVLGARSTVFRAMFASDMLEGSKRSLELTDIDADTAERMLMYAYADQEPSPELEWNSLADLHAAADKYQLVGLRKICCDRLSRELDVDTALQIADRDTLLKKKLVEFVAVQGPVPFEYPV